MSALRYPVLTLRRRDLVVAGACKEWLATFDAICAMRGDATAPSVRRKDGTSYRDPTRLRIELTPLAQVWAARDAKDALDWLRARGIWPRANLGGADLRGADLGGADLDGANLRGADLGGADLCGADLRGARRRYFDPAIPGWRLVAGDVLDREVAP